MHQTFSKFLIQNLIDWLIAFCIAFLLLWFVVTQPIFNKTKDQGVHLVDTDKLKRHVEMLTVGYAPRTINYDNLNNTADYIFRQFSELGKPNSQSIHTISNSYRNVSLQIGPNTQELYVIGAHYDSKDDSIDSEGNASGVATLIELARLLAENSHKLEVGVILIAYPLSMNQSDNIVNTGSYAHAISLKQNNKKIRLMISLDSVGQKYVKKNTKSHIFKFLETIYPQGDNQIKIVGRFRDFNSIREVKKEFNSVSTFELASRSLSQGLNKADFSDHLNYWKQGYPAVLISDLLYQNNKTHILDKTTKVDLLDRLDYSKMASLVRGLFQVLVHKEPESHSKTQLALQIKNKKTKPLLQ